MIAKIIEYSARNKFIVFLLVVLPVGLGLLGPGRTRPSTPSRT